MLGEEYTSAGNESDNESSEEDRDHGDAITTQNLNVNGLDEEEDLGKVRQNFRGRRKQLPEGLFHFEHKVMTVKLVSFKYTYLSLFVCRTGMMS